MTKFNSIVIQAHWFDEGNFWTVGADGYDSDNDEPESIETDPHCLSKEYTKDDVAEQLENIVDMWLSQNLSESITILIDGNEVKTKKLCQHAAYQVIVGNIGTVYEGKDIIEAVQTYDDYKQQSESGIGRAGGETVTLMDGEDNKIEHIPEDSMETQRRDEKNGLYPQHEDTTN